MFGNAAATSTAATVTGDAITVPVPRLASDGPIPITSPGGRVLTTTSALVHTYRNTNGFSFPNRGWSPSINGEVDAWGPNQVWLNLCPIPGCYWLADGTPSVEYGLFSAIGAPILASGNGSCFGFSLASRRLARREGPTRRSSTAPGVSSRSRSIARSRTPSISRSRTGTRRS